MFKMPLVSDYRKILQVADVAKNGLLGGNNKRVNLKRLIFHSPREIYVHFVSKRFTGMGVGRLYDVTL